MRGSERGACTMPRCRRRPKASLPLQADDEVEALVEHARERVRRIEAERRQHRHDLFVEIVARATPAARRSIRDGAGSGCLACERGSRTSLSRRYCSAHQAACSLGDACQLFRRAGIRRAPAGAPSSMRCFRPATRISKNSSRLVQTMPRKRSRSSSGTSRVLRLGQHALVELEQAELAVDVRRLVHTGHPCAANGEREEYQPPITNL